MIVSHFSRPMNAPRGMLRSLTGEEAEAGTHFLAQSKSRLLARKLKLEPTSLHNRKIE
jgi:hypothetical protein